jgi:phosphatidylserine/phosphatidylglycerophosphate/cardiolipin synthase-like enzyme
MARSKRKITKKKSGVSNLIWLIIASITGGGGYLGSDELKWVWEHAPQIISVVKKIEEKVSSSSPSSPTEIVQDANSPMRVYFTRPGLSTDDPNHIARQLAKYISMTRQTLDVCAFELDSKIITEALVDAVKRGVRVRVVTDTDYLDEYGIQTLRALRVPIVDDQRNALMHNKFMVFDNKAVWTGSVNFTENCTIRNDNHGVIIDDTRLAANYATKFSWFFEQRRFGSRPSIKSFIPNPSFALRDGTPIENYYSTHDGCASRIMEALSTSNKSIHFLAFSFTHSGIANVMISKANKGVKVEGVFERSQGMSVHSQIQNFRSRGQEVYFDGNPRNMHHKVIIIDDETVIFGSFNFSESADKSNDENIVIVKNKNIAAIFEQEYQRVKEVAKAAPQN